jgi:4-carboxymuconolactone decarboxylase
MSVSETARKNHDALFPNHTSVLGVTDPEIVEIFGNFAFDEVLRESRLDVRTRLIVLLGAMIGGQCLGQFRIQAGAALNVGVTPVELKEVVYQAIPYAGLGVVVDYLTATNAILTERGIALPLPPQRTTTPEDRAEKGLAIQSQLLGAEAQAQNVASAPADQKHFQRFLTEHCFGEHFTRSGLDLRTRELVVFSMLVAMGGCEPQVRAHAAANVKVGNDRARLVDVLTVMLPFVGYARVLNGLRMVNEVTSA